MRGTIRAWSELRVIDNCLNRDTSRYIDAQVVGDWNGWQSRIDRQVVNIAGLRREAKGWRYRCSPGATRSARAVFKFYGCAAIRKEIEAADVNLFVADSRDQLCITGSRSIV